MLLWVSLVLLALIILIFVLMSSINAKAEKQKKERLRAHRQRMAKKKELKKETKTYQSKNYYTTPRLYKFQMKGTAWRDLERYYIGNWFGYVKTDENNEFDDYAIAVYHEDNTLVGYLPKESMTAFHTLKDKYQNKLRCYIQIWETSNDYKEWLTGNLEIPFGYSKEAISEIDHIMSFFNRYNKSGYSRATDTIEYFNEGILMENLTRKYPDNIMKPYNIPELKIYREAKYLNANGDYKSLSDLEQFGIIIDRLKTRTKNQVLKMIEEAKSKV